MLALTVEFDKWVDLRTADGTSIRIKIYHDDRNHLKLGIEAPLSVSILRETAKDKGEWRQRKHRS